MCNQTLAILQLLLECVFSPSMAFMHDQIERKLVGRKIVDRKRLTDQHIKIAVLVVNTDWQNDLHYHSRNVDLVFFFFFFFFFFCCCCCFWQHGCFLPHSCSIGSDKNKGHLATAGHCVLICILWNSSSAPFDLLAHFYWKNQKPFQAKPSWSCAICQGQNNSTGLLAYKSHLQNWKKKEKKKLATCLPRLPDSWTVQ